MGGSTFLLQFQEKLAIKKMSENNPSSACSQTGTETCTFTREERDQDKSALSLGTRTITETREESDQDFSNSVSAFGTQTFTRTREEPDQDFSNSSYTTLPRY